MATETVNPFDSLKQTLAFDPRDWGRDRRDAWLWGIIFGWDNEAMEEMREKHHWTNETCKRLLVLHDNFLIAKGKWEKGGD